MQKEGRVFFDTLEATAMHEKISKDIYLDLVGRNEASMLIQQLIYLMRKIRFCQAGKGIRYHLHGLAFVSVGIANLNEFEVRVCRWHDMEMDGFTKDFCVFTDQSDLAAQFSKI